MLFRLPLSPFSHSADFLQQLRTALNQQHPLTISFVNPQAWYRSQQDSTYRHNLRALDIILADGIGVVKTLKWIHNLDIPRLSFDATSLYRPVIELLCQHHHSIFIIGAAPGIATAAANRMQNDFPDLHIAGHLHGHGPIDQAITTILDAKPAIVLCGMGVPRQEQFILALKQAGFDGVSITCGGFLDQLVERQQYYPAWVDRYDLRWLYRLYKEPKRLARRYLIEYLPFIGMALNQLIRRKLLFGLPTGPARQE